MGKAGRIMIFGLSLGIFIFAGLKLYGIYREYSVGADLYGDMVKQFVQEAGDGQGGSDGDELANGRLGNTNTWEDGINTQKNGINTQKNGINTQKNQATAWEGQAAAQITPSMDPGKVPITIDFASVKSQCPDIVGWLYCADTPINYPVVQSEDNDYYLYRLMDGTENKNGTIFMDFRNDAEFGDWNHLIYGHNMKNGAMFGSLTDYMEQEFYDMHPFWFLLTEEKNYRIDLVGGYVTPDGSEAYALPTDAAGRDALFQMASRSSVFDADVELMSDDRLITMSTCVYDYEDARFVLVGMLREAVDREPRRAAGE